jgi:hypothetical protein
MPETRYETQQGAIVLKRKCKVVAVASALAMTSGLIGVAAPAAYAAVTPVGGCGGAISIIKDTSPTLGQGLTDQTQESTKSAGNLAKDVTTRSPISGSCSGTVTRPGDPHVPGGANPSLTPRSAAISLLGNASCSFGATPQAADATAAEGFPPSGKITWTFFDTYLDLISALPRQYKMQAYVQQLGLNPSYIGDVVDIGGVVTSGVDVGATVSGSIWEDPVVKGGTHRSVTDATVTNGSTEISSATANFAPTDVGGTVTGAGIPAGDTIANVFDGSDAELSAPATSDQVGDVLSLNGDAYNTNYLLNIGAFFGCFDGVPGNANITQELSGGGGATDTSLLGESGIPGLSFTYGE